MRGAILPLPQYAFMAWCLVKHRDNFTFTFNHRVQTGCGAHQPTIQWIPGSLSLGVKRPGREADHSPPSSAEV
jgi:hypothetical protein